MRDTNSHHLIFEGKQMKETVELIDLLMADTVTYIQTFAEENNLSYDEALIRITGEHRTARRLEATAHLEDSK
jgi:hypothetical protein